MIHYQLRCADSHEFDGWFKDSAAFEKLAAAGMVQCPACGDGRVTRALMAPAIPKKGRPARNARPEFPAVDAPTVAPPVPAAPPVPVGPRAATGPMPAQVRALLQRIRSEVEKSCDYVGPDFAEEARRMARGESDRRGIYGEASEADSEALREEGIEVARIPWVPPADA
jgi:hypothetical protein